MASTTKLSTHTPTQTPGNETNTDPTPASTGPSTNVIWIAAVGSAVVFLLLFLLAVFLIKLRRVHRKAMEMSANTTAISATSTNNQSNQSRSQSQNQSRSRSQSQPEQTPRKSQEGQQPPPLPPLPPPQQRPQVPGNKLRRLSHSFAQRVEKLTLKHQKRQSEQKQIQENVTGNNLAKLGTGRSMSVGAASTPVVRPFTGPEVIRPANQSYDFGSPAPPPPPPPPSHSQRPPPPAARRYRSLPQNGQNG